MLLAPCSSWSSTFNLPESFAGVSANVVLEYPLALASQETMSHVSASFRLRSSARQRRLLLPVAFRQDAIQAAVTYQYRSSKATATLAVEPGELFLSLP